MFCTAESIRAGSHGRQDYTKTNTHVLIHMQFKNRDLFAPVTHTHTHKCGLTGKHCHWFNFVLEHVPSAGELFLR